MGAWGYYTPQGDELQVERFLNGEDKGYAERTMCLYSCDLALEVLSDVRYLAPEEIDKEKVGKKVGFVRERCKVRDRGKSKKP